MMGRNKSFFSLQKNRRQRIKKRDVFAKRFKNPYFIKSRMPKRTRAPKLKVGLGILCLLGIVGVFIIHPFFIVSAIEIKGNKTIPSKEILSKIELITNSKRFLFFSGKNIFLINKNKIRQELQDNFIFEDFKISTNFPKKLIIELTEKEAKVILLVSTENEEDWNFLVLDEKGQIIRYVEEYEVQTQLSSLPKVLIEKNTVEYKLNNLVLSAPNYEFIKFLEEKINGKNNISVARYVLSTNEEKVVNIITGEGWKIIVDRQNDWKKQVQVLETILKDKIKDRKNLKYIDVRFENRSYFQ